MSTIETSSFFSTHFAPQICKAIALAGYEAPTPIQEKAIPEILAGKDLLGLAQTGTGKTAAFVLPILQSIQANRPNKISALIIAPTRELVDQITANIQTLAKGTGIKAVPIYGAMGMPGQVSALRRGCDIVVACPGRLLDHIQRRTIDLREIKFLVLDEADMMFDMGFLPFIRQILKTLPPKRQSLLFSATMPREIRSLAMEALRNPVTIQVSPSAPATTVSHALYPVTQELKASLTLAILKQIPTGSVLIFCRTKHRAKRLYQHIVKSYREATCLQGNLSQNRRKEALDGFRSGKYRIMVATDIAARGIDVSSVSHVINFDIPDTVDAYTHRIGRTGRAARTGDAFTLVTGEDNSTIRNIERAVGKSIERRHLKDFDYKARPAGSPQQQRESQRSKPFRGERRDNFRGKRGYSEPREQAY